MLSNVCVYMFVSSFALEEGAGQEPVGGGKTVLLLYIYILEEGAVREPVEGGKTVLLLYIHTNTYIYRRKGPCGSR